jgi:hypothetical protein
MMKKLVLLGFILIGSQFVISQEALNNYKYIIVPKHFDFQSGADSYKINSLTRFLLNKKGFNTLFEDTVYPDDLKHDRCLALKVNLLTKSNFTRIKIKAIFLNCENEIVYTTDEGWSKNKDYQRAYHEAIRATFKSLDGFEYNYKPKPIVIAKAKDNNTAKNLEVAHKVVITKTIFKEPKDIEKIKELKKTHSIVGLYVNGDNTYEIAPFQDYYIFSKRVKRGNSFRSQPLGFIYKTSKKGNYLVKTTSSYTGYLKNNDNFVVDEINSTGAVNPVIYTKTDD